MLIESMILLSKRGVSASTRSPFCLSRRRRTKSRSRSLVGSGTAPPVRLEAIRHDSAVVIADVRGGVGAVETVGVEFLWVTELLGEVLQHAEHANHQRVPGLFRRADQKLECALGGNGRFRIVARLPHRIELPQSIVALIDDLREAVRAGGPGNDVDNPAGLKRIEKVIDDGGGGPVRRDQVD